MRSIICCLLFLRLVAPSFGETTYQWPDAPPEVLREEIFGLRFRQALDRKGPDGARAFLQKEMAKGFQAPTRAYVAWVSLFSEAWGIPALVDASMARQLAEDAVVQGSAVAADVLGRARIYGLAGIGRDEKEGFALLERAVAQGLPRALAKKGVFLMQGVGGNVRIEEGAALVRRAAALGSLVGLEEVADGYAAGKIGQAADQVQALEYYYLLAQFNDGYGWKKLQQAEEGKIPGARLLRALAYVRFANDGGRLAPTVVRRHLATLEEIGQNDSRAWVELGEAHMEGIYAKRDYTKAQDYLRKARAAGNKEAGFFLAYARMRGFGVPREPRAAMAEMQALAEAGDGRAADRLGFLYYWGASDVPGLKKDPDQAFAFVRRGAEAGYQHSAMNLAFCYENGIGTKVNYILAAKMYSIASSAGYPAAEEKLVRTLAFIPEPKER